MNVIHIYRGDVSYLSANFIKNASGVTIPDPKFVDLFGTHILPVGFTIDANPGQVVAKLQSYNPDALVIS